jgi:hypothetical protein
MKQHLELTEELADEALSSVVGGCPGHEDIMPADEPEPPPRPRRNPTRAKPAPRAQPQPAPRAPARTPRGGGTSADGYLNGMDLDFFKFMR